MSSVLHMRKGFSLVEVTLALGVTAFCLLAIFGLLPVGLNSNQNAIEQTAAAGITTGITTDLRAAPPTGASAGKSPRYDFNVTQSGLQARFIAEDGTDTKGDLSKSRYRANLWCTPPASGHEKEATIVRIFLTWPAQADSTLGTAPTKFSGSFEVMTTLDRN